MDVSNSKALGGSLQISTDVIAKIARLATLEIEGVKRVAEPESGVQGFFKRMAAQKPILVELSEDIAEITVNIVVEYGCKSRLCAEKVQENDQDLRAEYDFDHGVESECHCGCGGGRSAAAGTRGRAGADRRINPNPPADAGGFIVVRVYET